MPPDDYLATDNPVHAEVLKDRARYKRLAFVYRMRIAELWLYGRLLERKRGIK